MKKIRIELAIMMRQVKKVVIEVSDDYDLEKHPDLTHEVFEADSDIGEGVWVDDEHWGCDEGTHVVLGPAGDDAVIQFRLVDDVVMGV